MLEQERLFYTAHEPEWLETHAGKFVVVKGEGLVGVFDSVDEALTAGAMRFGLTSFLVRRVGEREQAVWIPALDLGLLVASP